MFKTLTNQHYVYLFDSNDISVSITDVMVSTTPATAGEEIGPFAFTQVFGGSTIPADDTFISTGTDKGGFAVVGADTGIDTCLLYTSPSPRDRSLSRMPSSA